MFARGWLWVGLAIAVAVPAPAAAEPLPTPKQGELRVVTYNVAGLPEGLSNVQPTRTLPLVGSHLNSELGDFRKLFREHGFLDSCTELRCREPARLDRVLYRNSGPLQNPGQISVHA